MTSVKTSQLTAADSAAQGDLLLLSDVSAGTSAKITTQDLIAQAYGDIKLAADSADQTLTATFAKLTIFDATTASLNCVVAADKDSITVDYAGLYMIAFSCNFSAATAKTFSFALSVGDAEDVDSQVVTLVPAAGATYVHPASFVILKSLAAAAVLTIEAKVHSATSVTTFNNIDLVIKKIDASA
jgi:hypothetical protein